MIDFTDELYGALCDDCDERYIIHEIGLTSASVTCGCNDTPYDIDLDDGQDEAAIYY